MNERKQMHRLIDIRDELQPIVDKLITLRGEMTDESCQCCFCAYLNEAAKNTKTAVDQLDEVIDCQCDVC